MGEVQNMEQEVKKTKKQNPMREIDIEKLVFNCGGTEAKHEKSMALLKMITGRKVQVRKSTRRIPAFGISPGKLSGCRVTIRNKEEIKNYIQRFFATLDDQIAMKKITQNQVSFGINEYIEVPGLEYQRDIGIMGFEVTIVFARKGKRAKMKKIKRGRYPQKQHVSTEEIIPYLKENFGVEIV